jgi:hypothetical protein
VHKEKKNTALKKIIITSLVLLFVLLTGGVFLKISNDEQKTISSNILHLTEPVETISAQIKKINKDSIVVSKEIRQEKNINVTEELKNGERALKQTVAVPVIKTLEYEVVIDDNTTIIRENPRINYLFEIEEEEELSEREISLKELETGMLVDIGAEKDLRLLKGDRFKADSIRVRVENNIITGLIKNISGDKVYLDAELPVGFGTVRAESEQRTTKEYEIRVTEDTEISNELCGEDECQRQQYSLADLKEGIEVTVYSDKNLRLNFKFDALRIEPNYEQNIEQLDLNGQSEELNQEGE